MKLFLIDGIGPFFRDYRKRQVNWSKVPFHSLLQEADSSQNRFERIADDMRTFASRVSEVGYNGITLDDVAHLAPDEWHEPEINRTITYFAEGYCRLFSICKDHGLDIYLTMDILSLTGPLKAKIGGQPHQIHQFLLRQIETIFTHYPEVRGLIFRIGECDGKDVKGIFKSELVLQTPKQVNTILRLLLPVFERHNRYLILRNWTVGAYSVGDFIWHRGTTAKILKGISSPNFILSLKYGESDYFRYLPLNKHFFRFKVKKIIELQARREYEGCGEYPSFIGWDYEAYARQLENTENMAGISVWCQTGGWVPFRRLTYLEEKGIWNELNSFVTLQVFKEKKTTEEAVGGFAEKIGCTDPTKLLELLRLNDQVIKELLYIKDIAGQKLFFRRVRIPPLLSVYWNNIFINHSVRKVLSLYVESGEASVQEGYLALEKIKKMQKMAKDLGLPANDIRYMYDTFSLLALAREYYFLPYDEEVRKKTRKAKKKYKKKYPKEQRPRYRVKTNFSPFFLKRRHLRWLLRIALRQKRGYRVLDYLITLHFLGVVYRLLIIFRPGLIPKFARKHAMGIETIFK